MTTTPVKEKNRKIKYLEAIPVQFLWPKRVNIYSGQYKYLNWENV